MNTDHDTIVAPATAAGGAIAVIRISGGEAFAVCDRIFRGRRPLAEADGYTVHYGTIAEGDRVIVVAKSLFLKDLNDILVR